MTDNARVKLAEAMGWTRFRGKYWLQPGITPEKVTELEKQTKLLFDIEVPDPFTDANDDYAVLEFFRDRGSKSQIAKFSENLANLYVQDGVPFDELSISLTTSYRIGDYFKAACATFGIELEGGD